MAKATAISIGYSNKTLESIRQRDHFGARPAGKLGIATALKNVSDVTAQLISEVDNGQATGDCSEAKRSIAHLIARLQAIDAAL